LVLQSDLWQHVLVLVLLDVSFGQRWGLPCIQSISASALGYTHQLLFLGHPMLGVGFHPILCCGRRFGRANRKHNLRCNEKLRASSGDTCGSLFHKFLFVAGSVLYYAVVEPPASFHGRVITHQMVFLPL